jgi:hypothetical protein
MMEWITWTVGLSGWAAFLLAATVKVGALYRVLGGIETEMKDLAENLIHAHKRIDKLESVPQLTRPCKEFLQLQREITDRLARIETKLDGRKGG